MKIERNKSVSVLKLEKVQEKDQKSFASFQKKFSSKKTILTEDVTLKVKGGISVIDLQGF